MSERRPAEPAISSRAVPARGTEARGTDEKARRPGMFRWTYGFVNRLVMLWDAALLTVTGLGVWLALGQQGLGLTGAQTAVVCVAGTGAYLYVLNATNAYRVERYRDTPRTVTDLLCGLSIGVALTGITLWAFLPETLAPWRTLAVWPATAWAVLFAGRGAVRLGLRRLHANGALCRKVVIVGAGERGDQVIAHLSDPRRLEHFDVTAIFDDRADTRSQPGPNTVSGTVDALLDYVQERPVDLVVVALPWQAAMRIYQLMQRLQTIPADIVIPLDDDHFRPRHAQVVSVGGLPALKIMQTPLKGSQVLLKLLEDYVVAGVALALTSPIMLVAAVLIRLDSPGPILFRQKRVGFNNELFDIYKFRTMSVDPQDDGSLGTRIEDPRITRIGRILRRTSIDELPQLINVLRGEMSVVGPRAHVPNMLVSGQIYRQAVREYATRYRIKPGITGWAQISGMRGGIQTIEKAKRGVELDIHYIDNWSLWFDVKIMVRTLITGMFGRDVF